MPTTAFRFSKHALRQLEATKIPQALVEAVLEVPEQKTDERDTITCYQSRMFMNQKQYLLRVLVNETIYPAIVVTAYRTSKIAKYWRTL
jgi:hypothetical protein